ncbi:hypothetical protein evm_010297 [Chilo suppressalis]|nr:hypothetical protein evm_010297 [Chilo suppressalis]
MMINLELVLAAFFGFFVRLTMSSIAGITYRDDYGVEERYRNINECNPFYWHPLHMPEHCTKMFEKLIRAGVGRCGPVRIVKEQNYPYEQFDESDEYDDTLPPYERMVQLLKKDVARRPSSPEITFFPGLGPAALYNQPVSKYSGDYMKAVAKAYKDISFGFGPIYNPLEIVTTVSSKEKDRNEKDITKQIGEIFVGGDSLRSNKLKNKPKYNLKKRINKGHVTTVLRTKHTELCDTKHQ